jgi:hypothetical protein
MENRKLIGILLAVLAILIVVVVVFKPLLFRKKQLPRPIMAIITLDASNNNVCRQTVSGVPTPMIGLLAASGAQPGTNVTWHGPVAGPAGIVDVQFPQGSPPGSGTPFVDPLNGQRKFDFGDGVNTGPPNIPMSGTFPFPFESVTVGGKPCSNPQSMGVQVTK